MQSFSNRLISLRKEQGYTQAELATALHIYRSTLSGYETEGKEPSQEILCKLADFFGVTTDYMLGISSQRTNTEAVFADDTNNLKAVYDRLPDDIKSIATAIFDSFYLIIGRDMKQRNAERLDLYRELFSLIQESRASIRNEVEHGNKSDPLYLSSLMADQNTFKNEVSVILDKLIQSDMGVSASKRGDRKSAAAKTAI